MSVIIRRLRVTRIRASLLALLLFTAASADGRPENIS